jgi:hypothetical protein
MRSVNSTTSQSTKNGNSGKLSWEVTYPLPDEQVLGLDVAVDHVLCVAVIERQRQVVDISIEERRRIRQQVSRHETIGRQWGETVS